MPNSAPTQRIEPDYIEMEPLEFLVTGPARDKQAENDRTINQALTLAGIEDEAERGWLKMRVDVIGVVSLKSYLEQVAMFRRLIADYFTQLKGA